MATKLDPEKTVLLFLDLQVGIMMRFPEGHPILDNAASAIAVARKHGVQVAHIRVALSEDDANAIPERNIGFGSVKDNKQMVTALHPDAPTSQIHPKLAVQEGDVVHRKIRYGPFMAYPSKAMLDDFEKKGIDTVIIGGVATSGAVLSAVRQLADLDYGLVVLEDCCADTEPDVHKILCEKVFPKQARVIKSDELESLL